MLTLNEAAALLQLHPRTVLRYITNDFNTYWTEDYDPNVKIETVASSFQCDPIYFTRTLNDRDAILTSKEAAAFLDLIPRTFRNHKYTPIIRQGHVVRYSRVALANEHFAQWD